MMRVWLIKCVLPYLTNDSPKGVQSMFAVERTSATFISSSNSITVLWVSLNQIRCLHVMLNVMYMPYGRESGLSRL